MLLSQSFLCICFRENVICQMIFSLAKLLFLEQIQRRGTLQTADGSGPLIKFEPAHVITALLVFRNLILQTRMRSHAVGLDV